MNIDNLTPEEKLIAIAKARGYEFKDESSRYPNYPDWQKYKAVYREAGFIGLAKPGWIPVPDYLSDANAALTLCAALANNGWRTEINQGTDGTWECEFYHVKTNTRHYAPAATLAAAICDAFLLTL